ncbi:MAG: NAD(P)/FAD-dependent oxidoreductase, partial [Steroidobacteraceae bacterium]
MGDAATDVLVIGGGPAGSTIATLLARRGHQVTLLERQRHPRFHIGESLLPANLPLLTQLGVADQVRAIGMPKLGAEFISHIDGREQDFRFSEAWDKSMPYAYHVRRSQFDEILLRNAGAAGARVIEACRARTVQLPAPGNADREVRVQAECEDGSTPSWRARYLVDASGRDTFLANALGAKRRNRRHNSAALFAHFSGGQRHEGERAGHISIYWFEHGWFWFIPLHDGVTSVGAVVWPHYLKSRTTPVKEFFLATIAQCPP